MLLAGDNVIKLNAYKHVRSAAMNSGAARTNTLPTQRFKNCLIIRAFFNLTIQTCQY